jgi:hypothetical protein
MTRYVIYQRAGARRGANTAHTQRKWDGLHTRGTYILESTHTRTHTNTNKHTTWPATKYSTVRTHAVAAHSSSEEGASPPPPASRISVLCRDLPRRSYVHRPTGAVPAARATSTSTSSLRSRYVISPRRNRVILFVFFVLGVSFLFCRRHRRLSCLLRVHQLNNFRGTPFYPGHRCFAPWDGGGACLFRRRVAAPRREAFWELN